jgi:hypothetical protein
MSGGPKGTPKMERSEREVTGIVAGEDPERRGQGDERAWSNHMNSHLAALGSIELCPKLVEEDWGGPQ